MKKLRQILIIDDDPAGLRLSEEVAREVLLADKVITRSTAFGALLYIKEHCLPTLYNQEVYCPELILIDIHMPGINGYEFIAELWAMEELRHENTCVIFISGNSYEEEKERVKYFPVLGYIEKPVTVEKLQALTSDLKSKAAGK